MTGRVYDPVRDQMLVDGSVPFLLRNNSNSNATSFDVLFSEDWACLFLPMLIIVKVVADRSIPMAGTGPRA